ncbi:LamG domain-containing protein [bacterium]|nr:LamG domain-containing protein [bacterium]
MRLGCGGLVIGLFLLLVADVSYAVGEPSNLLEKWTFNSPSEDGDIFVSEGKWKSRLKMQNYFQVKTPGEKGIELKREKQASGFCPESINWAGERGPSVLSVEAWIKLYEPALQGLTVVLAKWQGGLLLRLWNGVLIWRHSNTGYKLKEGKWYHLVYTVMPFKGRPGATENFYVDGKSILSKKTYAFDWGLADTYLCIGTHVPKIGLFDGIIDEIRIWEKELSPQDVEESYNEGPTVTK